MTRRRRLAGLLALSLLAWLPIWAHQKEPPRSEAYREGQRALDDQDWATASRLFGSIAAKSSDETDAALYWKAYADAKRGAKKDALDGLRKLQSSYPQSSWADDAKALEMELRDGKSAVTAAGVEDEELKLYALDGLMQVEPEKAVPILEKILAGNSSEKLKQRALFVLSQSDSPRARDILVRTAKTGQPMSLRTEAVKTLGIAGGREDIVALREIAKDTSAPYEVRAAVVEAYLISGRSEGLVGLATTDPDPRIPREGDRCARRERRARSAAPALGDGEGSGAPQQAVAIVRSRRRHRDAREDRSREHRSEPPPQGDRRARHLRGCGPSAPQAVRRAHRPGRQEEDRQRADGQGDAHSLIELFRAEKDREMKKTIVQQLSVMDDPEVTRFLMDVLGEKP
jgi:hypothetical protein